MTRAAQFRAALGNRPLRRAVWAEALALWRLAWPVMVGQLATVGMSVADVTMTGHFSPQDLAGVSLGSAIWNMVMLTVLGLAMSINPLVAHEVGAGQPEQVPALVRQSLWKAALVGLLACLVVNASTLLFDHMALEPRVRAVAVQFTRTLSAALPALAAYRALYGYSTSLGQTKPMMVIALLACALNAGLNAVLVYGHLGFPALGGVGCAWATLVCLWLQLAALVWWMRRSPAYASTWPFDRFEWPHRPSLDRLFRLGVPIGIAYLAETSAFSLIALLIARFGSHQVAAHAIALNFTSLVFMVPLSLGLALLTRTGHSLGAGDRAGARLRVWVGLGITWAFAALAALCMGVFGGAIAQAYTNDAAVAALAAQLLLLAALFQLSDCTQVVCNCALRAYKVTRAPMVLHLTAFWGFSLPLGYALGRAPQWLVFAPATPMAAQGFWVGLIVGLSVAAVGLVWMLRTVSRGEADTGFA